MNGPRVWLDDSSSCQPRYFFCVTISLGGGQEHPVLPGYAPAVRRARASRAPAPVSSRPRAPKAAVLSVGTELTLA